MIPHVDLSVRILDVATAASGEQMTNLRYPAVAAFQSSGVRLRLTRALRAALRRLRHGLLLRHTATSQPSPARHSGQNATNAVVFRGTVWP